MKEMQVLTDVRLSPDSTELLLTRQTVRVEGGELRRSVILWRVSCRCSCVVPRSRLAQTRIT